MAKLYVWNIAPYLPEGRWRVLLEGLPAQRCRRALSCRQAEDSARCAGAGWLLRHALDQEGIPPSAQVFTQNSWGKPALLHASAPQFSLSHSGTWVLCAVGGSPLGVDIELPRCTIQLARRFFHPQETASVEALPPSMQLEALCRLWVAKEAVIKAEGRGLSMPLSSFCVQLRASGACLAPGSALPPYRLHEYRLGAYRICLCTEENRPVLTFVADAAPAAEAVPEPPHEK